MLRGLLMAIECEISVIAIEAATGKSSKCMLRGGALSRGYEPTGRHLARVVKSSGKPRGTFQASVGGGCKLEPESACGM